jgi:D-serine deaminase-like pyridoxal phosphate-dependent protein
MQMAEYFAADGWEDITVAFPVNLRESDLINRLARRVKLNVLAEDPEVIAALNRKMEADIGVFLKIDVGTHRTGIDPQNQTLLDACVEALQRSKHLIWKGLLAHAGHTYQVRRDVKAVQDIYRNSVKVLKRIKARYIDKYQDLLISFGDTPGASMVDQFEGIDEMRPGNFVFYDLMQYEIGSCGLGDVAVKLYCPVVAVHPGRNTFIIYGGAIHLSKDSVTTRDGKVVFGAVYRVDAKGSSSQKIGFIMALSQEHGVVELTQGMESPNAGDLVSVVPVHSCLTAQCMGYLQDHEGEAYDHFAQRQSIQ